MNYLISAIGSVIAVIAIFLFGRKTGKTAEQNEQKKETIKKQEAIIKANEQSEIINNETQQKVDAIQSDNFSLDDINNILSGETSNNNSNKNP